MNPYFIFEITPRCNNDCLYCYNVWKDGEKYPKGELPLSDIKKLFEKLLAEINPSGITLAGGEPMLRSDICEIAAFLKENKINAGIATNGTLLNENNTAQLIENGIKYFELSLPGANSKTYENLSQNGKMEKVRNAILLIKKHRIPLTVSFIITKINFGEIGEIIDLCFAFSADSLALNRFVPGGRGLQNRGKLEITEKELESVLKIADKKSAEYNFPINITIPVEPCIFNRKKYKRLNFGACVCGKYKWVIDPLGNLRTCEQNPEILGNLFENTFKKLSSKKEVGNFLAGYSMEKCEACSEFAFCGGSCRFLKHKRLKT